MEKHTTTKALVGVYALLMLLLGLTLGSSYLELGIWNSVLNLGIAVLKAALIAWFFMHLRHSPPAVGVAAGVGLLWLLPLFWLTLVDYANR